VKAFAARDEQLRCNQLFSGQHAAADVHDHFDPTALDPRIVNRDHAVAHAGDQVDVEIVAMGLGQPHRIANLALKSCRVQFTKRALYVLWSDEDVEILGVAPDAGV